MGRFICSYALGRGISAEEFFRKEPTDKQTKKSSQNWTLANVTALRE